MTSGKYLQPFTSLQKAEHLYIINTVGARTFLIAGDRIWNGLPVDMTSAPSLTVFRQHLKTVLFHRSYQNA